MANKKEHASHNRELAQILLDGKKYYDWCITSSFYSALHFVDIAIFPFKLSHDITCHNLREAQQKLMTPDLHETRARMVQLQCSEISKAYRWLKDQAHDSRYVTFKFQHSQADKALTFLKQIEEYCLNIEKKQLESKKISK